MLTVHSVQLIVSAGEEHEKGSSSKREAASAVGGLLQVKPVFAMLTAAACLAKTCQEHAGGHVGRQAGVLHQRMCAGCPETAWVPASWPVVLGPLRHGAPSHQSSPTGGPPSVTSTYSTGLGLSQPMTNLCRHMWGRELGDGGLQLTIVKTRATGAYACQGQQQSAQTGHFNEVL